MDFIFYEIEDDDVAVCFVSGLFLVSCVCPVVVVRLCEFLLVEKKKP